MTLFKFLKKPIEVSFFTHEEAVFNFCRPEKAAKFMPDWWKKMPRRFAIDGGEMGANNTVPTMKSCPGIVDLYSKGFIQPLWSDLRVDIMPDGAFRYQFSDGVSSASPHLSEQIPGSPLPQRYTHLKLESPWVAKEDSNLKFLACAPIWNDFGAEDIIVPPGVLSFKRFLELNVNMFFKRNAETTNYELRFGQPIVHFIPLSDDPIKLRYELVSKEEFFKILSQNGRGFFFENKMRKASKLCPYA